MNLKGRDFSEIIRKIKKRIRLKFADNIHIRHVDEVAITPVLKCNLNCVMCHQGQIKCKKDMSFDDFKKILWRLKSSGVTKVSLVGGEIFTHPQIWEFIKEMEKQKLKFDLSSNLFNVPGIERFKHLRGLEMVTTSIDGPEDIHNKIRRNPRAFQNATENIKKLLKDNIRVDVACVVQKANFDILEETLILICKLGVRSVSYLFENSITEKEKEIAIKQIKNVTGSDPEIYISSLQNPLGYLTENDFKQIPAKVENLKKIGGKFGASVSFPVQMTNPEVLDKKTSLKDYSCSLFNGYNGLVYNDGTLNSCGFVKLGEDHNLLTKSPLQIFNSKDYFKKRVFFKKYGALGKCRRCCALKKK